MTVVTTFFFENLVWVSKNVDVRGKDEKDRRNANDGIVGRKELVECDAMLEETGGAEKLNVKENDRKDAKDVGERLAQRARDVGRTCAAHKNKPLEEEKKADGAGKRPDRDESGGDRQAQEEGNGYKNQNSQLLRAIVLIGVAPLAPACVELEPRLALGAILTCVVFIALRGDSRARRELRDRAVWVLSDASTAGDTDVALLRLDQLVG